MTALGAKGVIRQAVADRQLTPFLVIQNRVGGGPLGIKGGCCRRVDGTAGLPLAPEMPCGVGPSSK
jgi:hypothetical protein